MLPSLAACIIVILSIYSNIYYSKDPKHCDGNYIQENYNTIQLPSTIGRFKLKRHLESNFKKDGIPVLFLPGNAGSYMQVRSLGAVWLRLWNKEYHSNSPLELYAIDTKFSISNSSLELSAFDSQYLKDQAYFANDAVKWILNKSKTYKTVYIIGHR